MPISISVRSPVVVAIRDHRRTGLLAVQWPVSPRFAVRVCGSDVASTGGCRCCRFGLAALSGQTVEVTVELLVGNRSFVVGGQSDRQWPTETDGGERNVGRLQFSAGRPVVNRGTDEPIEDVASGVTLFGPVAVVEQWMHDVDNAQSSIDGGMQIPTQSMPPPLVSSLSAARRSAIARSKTSTATACSSRCWSGKCR